MSPARKGIAGWYAKAAAFNVESLFSRRKQPGPPRTVFVNENLPADYFDNKGRPRKHHIYSTNQVITSKYTVVTFIPRNLLEQFRRIANVFFLGIAILQFFPKFSTISPGLVILPLLIVLGITAIKDGWEDIKRHQSDRSVNHSLVRVLSGGDWVNPNFMGKKSRTFVRGLLRRGHRRVQTINNPQGRDINTLEQAPPPAHVQTIEYDDVSTEDGQETGGGLFGHHDHVSKPHWKKTMWEDVRVGDFVKIMDNESFPADILICATSEDENVAYVETKNLDGETSLKSRNAVPMLTHLRTAADCASKLNTFRVDCDRPDVNMYRLDAAVLVNDAKAPVDMQTLLLRGTVLRNTGWVIGVVLYTGEDTKIVLNSGGTPSKRSKVERQMNPQVFINLIILAMMAIACAIVDSVLEHRYYPLGAPWLFGDNLKDDNPSINGLVTWAFALITFQNIVPISLYISIEFVRTCQAAFIYFDKDIMYEKNGQATVARSWNLSDDLGQIQYIFSDKTGTLTQNSMIFRQCSVGGKVYKGDPASDESDSTLEKKISTSTTEPAKPVSASISPPEYDAASASGSVSPPVDTSTTITPSPLLTEKVKLSAGVLKHFHDATLKVDLADAVSAGPNSEGAPLARALNGFFVVLALCHTALASVDPKSGAIEYKAQSPDEAALVQAAADVGFVFRGRDRETLFLQTPFSDEIERYELLNILEFTSARKRMSVVLRKLDGEDGRLFLLTKGADNVVFERLKSGGDELKAITEQHLEAFASEGLRTLTLAYKVIGEAEYASWSERYHEATVSMEDREGKIEAISDELEQDLRLLGATAVEDKLQDGVPEAIADLKRAGIKIWVATGDKLETAIAIGYSTNLIGRESNIIVIRGGKESERPIYQQMMHAVEEFFPESGILDENGGLAEMPRTSISSDRPGLSRVETGISSIVGSNNGDRPGGFVLVIDGSALGYALDDERNKSLLLRLAMQCEGVVCCRVSPLQKALVVRLVKNGLGVMTLAIGDGANDVSMIQAADVGVGISGEEGLQAVNSSDYAIAQFRFLVRLLFVHGHWSYARNANMILNFFYKNIVCIGVLWWFQIYCGWSSNYVFEYTYLLFWNSFWTIAPVIGIGVFDRLVDDHILMAIPELYRHGREGRWFGLGQFVVYMLDGVYQSAIIYFLILYAYFSPTSRADGFDVGLYEFSTTMVLSAVMAANLFNGLNTNVWTAWVFFAVFIGIVLVWVYTALYTLISPGWFYTPVYGNYRFLFPSAYFWLCMPITVLLALLPRYVGKAWRFGFAPDDISTLRWIHKKEPHRDVARDAQLGGRLAALRRPASIMSRTSTADLSLDPRRQTPDNRSASRTDMATGIRSIHRGFNFSTEENGVAMQRIQSNLTERRQSSRNLSAPVQTTRSSLVHHVLTIPKSLRKKKPSTPPNET